MLSLYKLEIFAAVVQAGSFSAAAERLYMTQPAVSQHIQALEAGVGSILFTRGRRGVKLTPIGEKLYEYTQKILHLVAEAEATVTQVENLAEGQLNIGATPGINVYSTPEWAQSFRDKYPNLGVSVHSKITTELVDDVLGHRLDLGIVEGELDTINRKGLGRIVLAPIELTIIVGQEHDWWGLDSVSVEQLHDQAFIARHQNSRTRVWLDRTFANHDVAPKIVAEFDSPESIKQAVKSGMGMSILPDYSVQYETKNKQLHAIHLRDVKLERQMKLIWDETMPLSPISRAFLQHFATYFPQVADLVTA